MKNKLNWFFVIMIITYPIAIISDIIYMNNHDMLYKYLYWVFFAIGGICSFVFSTLNIRQAKNREK